ncbi:hypothetical protein [Azospirillum sp.]|uniref:hypothetical protein n=1 Tax=Azospirillum sp. TaxID=34012 RepID=UPI003D7282DA
MGELVTLPRPTRPAALQQGVTQAQAQAMELFRLFFCDLVAGPAAAVQVGIPYPAACDVLEGKLWPGVRRHWMDLVLP